MIKLYVNNRGWVLGFKRNKNDDIINVRYCRSKASAKPFGDIYESDPDLYDILLHLENKVQCHYDIVRY